MRFLDNDVFLTDDGLLTGNFKLVRTIFKMGNSVC